MYVLPIKLNFWILNTRIAPSRGSVLFRVLISANYLISPLKCRTFATWKQKGTTRALTADFTRELPLLHTRNLINSKFKINKFKIKATPSFNSKFKIQNSKLRLRPISIQNSKLINSKLRLRPLSIQN